MNGNSSKEYSHERQKPEAEPNETLREGDASAEPRETTRIIDAPAEPISMNVTATPSATQTVLADQAGLEDNPDVLSLRLWKSGNMRGYNELIQRYERPLICFILRIVRDPDESKDVLQETFVRLYRSLPKLREDKSLKAWLFQTANNLSIDWLRKRKPDRLMAVDHQDFSFQLMVESSDKEKPARPDESYQDEWMHQKILEAIEQLPKKQRMVMTLRSCQGLSLKEIAEILGSNEKTVGTTLFAARKKLMKQLKPALKDMYGDCVFEGE